MVAHKSLIPKAKMGDHQVPASLTKSVPGHPGLQRKTLFQKFKQTNKIYILYLCMKLSKINKIPKNSKISVFKKMVRAEQR